MKQFVVVLGVLLMAIVPGALRVCGGQTGWVLVRVGARPAHDDPNQRMGERLGAVLEEAGGAAVGVVAVLLAGLVGLLRAAGLVRVVLGFWERMGDWIARAFGAEVGGVGLGRAPPVLG